MSCSAVAAAAVFWLAAADPSIMAPPAPPPAVLARSPLAQEPLFADIVGRAGKLKAEADAFKGADTPVPEAFKQAVADLAALDMKGHIVLKERGTDGDLKCILKGISEDLPLKLQALVSAATPATRKAAALDLAYLLNDNVEVITAPPAAPV